MTGKELIKKFKSNGWILDRIRGSHYILIKGNETVVVPVHSNKDIPKGTLENIFKKAGLK
ncbi:hypothetical protein LCGC14_2877420 [marine sediment metagenome]|uniref:Addiction module toxin, HicA family n=1 Tax=marine sediment metagenome TaxID=412755 RepID=A0A0F8Y144_9ZZZZ